jgi:hypothetical protein
MMHVLEQPLVLDLVLQYAGPDQWLFLGAVSKTWAVLHSSVMHQHVARRQRALRALTSNAKTTSFAAAAASLARVLYACDCDVKLKTEKLLFLGQSAASCGSSGVLIWAKAIAGSKWLDWHQELCMAAAAGNQLATLQSLRTTSAGPEQQWEVVKVATKAAECADLSMLQWLLEQQPKWTVGSIVTVGKATATAADAIGKIELLCQRFPARRNRLRSDFALASIKCGAVASLKFVVATGFEFDHQHFTTSASAAGQRAVLRYLVKELGCPWDVTAVRTAAVTADNAEILQWLTSADDAVWTTAQLLELLAVACQNDKLLAAKWLRAAGAEWPTGFFYTNHHFMHTLWPTASYAVGAC